jgi:DNA-binding transcriptional LysR family regulator
MSDDDTGIRHQQGGSAQLGSIDLNLLVPLQALLEERSVSRAADRLYMSQPALSGALARLRRHFDDELLVRSGNSYQLSPLAGDLLEEIARAASSLGRVFSARAEFLPAESRREFQIVCSDYVSAEFGAELSRELSRRAPGAMVRFEHMQDALVDNAPESLREVDGLILPHGYIDQAPHVDLFTDPWMCVIAAGTAAPRDVAELGERPWATTYNGRTAVTTAARELLTLGVSPRTQVTTRSFLTLGDMVAGTDRVAFAPASVAARLAHRDDIVVVDSPLELPPIREAFWWSPSFTDDVGHRWLRELVAEVAAAQV